MKPDRKTQRAAAVWLWLVMLALGLATDTGRAQTGPGAPHRTGVPADVTAQFQSRLDAAREDLNRVLAAERVSTNLPPGATATEVIERRAALQRLVRTYQFHLDDLAALVATQQRQEDLNRTIRSWSGFAEPAPYSLLFVDDLRDTVQSLKARLRAAEVTQAVAEKFRADGEAAMKEADEALRRLNDQLERASDSAAAIRLAWQRELEQVRHQMAAASVASFETKRQMAESEMAENRQRLAFVQRQVVLAVQGVRFSQADLDRVMDGLASEQRQLDGEIQVADAELEARQKALASAREELRKGMAARPEGNGQAASLRRLQELVDVRSTQVQTSVHRLTVLRQLLEGIGSERQTWQMRFAVFGSRDATELQTAGQRLSRLSGLIQAAKPYYRQQIELAANQIVEQQNRRQNQVDVDVDPVLARESLETFQQREALYYRALQSLEKRERLVSRWQDSLDFDRKALPFTGRVRDLFTGASTFVAKLWHFELLAVEDTITVDGQRITGRRGVTTGKITTAILILVAGYWLSNLVARVLERLAVRRLKVEPNQANLVRRWVRVLLVLGLVLVSLVVVKIPLTVFAFAGGALAIGIGFGTQNLLKNFISGIIILFERPFRVGDVIDVSGHRGTVTGIGIRSSVIQLWDNTETLIPNSALLENNLTNWTYSNRTVRFTLALSVTYGADTRRVAQLLGEIASRHGLVQKEPKPQVLFTHFGESALDFELRYWVDVLAHNAAQVASDLRHMAAGSFAEAGIAMAYPQRDLHLDTLRPLQVEVLPAPRPEPASAPPSVSPGRPSDSAPPADSTAS